MNWPLLISLTSLAFVLLTFYLTNVRPPKIRCQIGPTLQVYHGDHAAGGSTGFYLPVTFENTSVRTGIVSDVGLLLYRKDQPEERFFMTWREFAKYDPVGSRGWKFDEVAHALAVPGRSTVTKIVWFMWFPESLPKLHPREGSYVVNLCYWTRLRKQPQSQRHEVVVDAETVSILQAHRAAHSNGSRILWLDKRLNYNELLTSAKSKAFLRS